MRKSLFACTSSIRQSVRYKSEKRRFNSVGIEMVQRNIKAALFPGTPHHNPVNPDLQKTINAHLDKFIENRKVEECEVLLDPLNIQLPPLIGRNLDEHFNNIALLQISEYSERLSELIASFRVNGLPKIPVQWSTQAGWTVYSPEPCSIDYPKDESLVFDVEVISMLSIERRFHFQLPVMATALGKDSWYSWCSSRLFSDHDSLDTRHDDLIPMDLDSKKRVFIGHNIGFDRSFIREQYQSKLSSLRFLDTMSLHIATSGYTSDQRTLRKVMNKYEESDEKDCCVLEGWMHESSANNLVDVHSLYCRKSKLQLSKELRSVFCGRLASPEDDLNKLRSKRKEICQGFQNLMHYCATDTAATAEVIEKIYPLFLERFPHPVTMAGTLIMGTMLLPVKKYNWQFYLKNGEQSYEDTLTDIKKTLARQSNRLLSEASSFTQEGCPKGYESDPWSRLLDWGLIGNEEGCSYERQETLYKLNRKSSKSILHAVEYNILKEDDEIDQPEESKQLKVVRESAKLLPVKSPKKVGYPKWYRDVCPDAYDEFKAVVSIVVLAFLISKIV
ncbi:hypothetical protein ACOME3_007337 [Neoechinorhynchus agilis]